jgi:hypothetical protein
MWIKNRRRQISLDYTELWIGRNKLLLNNAL